MALAMNPILQFALFVIFVASITGCEKKPAAASPDQADVGNALSSFQIQFDLAETEGSNEFVYRDPISTTELGELTKLDLERLELFSLKTVSANEIANALKAWPKLRRLRLESLHVDDAVMQAIAKLEELEVLNVPDGNFSDTGVHAICSLPKLWLLRFGSPRVTDVGIRKLVELPALRFLHLINVPLTDEGLAAFNDFHQLESFYIDNGEETENGIRELLKHHKNRLHFHRNQIHIPEDPNADQHE